MINMIFPFQELEFEKAIPLFPNSVVLIVPEQLKKSDRDQPIHAMHGETKSNKPNKKKCLLSRTHHNVEYRVSVLVSPSGDQQIDCTKEAAFQEISALNII